MKWLGKMFEKMLVSPVGMLDESSVRWHKQC